MTTAIATGRVRIPRELNGPRRSANGGFACGMFASAGAGPAQVRLLRKVPLERDLDLVPDENGGSVVRAGSAPVAVVRDHPPFVDLPPVRPGRHAAHAAREAHPFRGVRHALSRCVVCGPERSDGLAVTPGPLAEAPDVLASPFVVRTAFARDGRASTESLWGALDCVSYPASLMRAGRIAFLGTLAADLHRLPAVGEELVAVGWSLSAGTRSHRTASALVDRAGDVVASGRATWVEARRQAWLRVASRIG